MGFGDKYEFYIKSQSERRNIPWRRKPMWQFIPVKLVAR